MKKVLFPALVLFLTPFICSADWSWGIYYAGLYSGLPYTSIYTIIATILLWLLQIFTILSVLAFVIYGVMFLMAGASSDMATKARKGISYSLLGIVTAISGYIIIIAISYILQGTIYK